MNQASATLPEAEQLIASIQDKERTAGSARHYRLLRRKTKPKAWQRLVLESVRYAFTGSTNGAGRLPGEGESGSGGGYPAGKEGGQTESRADEAPRQVIALRASLVSKTAELTGYN